jgi:hypothetical protein
VKTRFSVRRVNSKHGRPGPGTEYEVVVRGFDERGYLYRESTVVSRLTGSDGTATRVEAQRHADWLNYAEECFYAGLPVPPHEASPTRVVEGDFAEIERRIAATMASGAQYDTGPDDPYSASTPANDA